MADYEMVPRELRDFLIYLEVIKGKSPNTVRAYFYDLQLFYRYFKIKNTPSLTLDQISTVSIADVPFAWIEKIRLSDLYEFMSYVNQKRANTSSARARKVSCLRTYFKYLTNKANLLKVDPSLELDSPKIEKRLPKYLDLNGSIDVLSAAEGLNQRDFCMLTLLLNCGLRVSELVGINRTDLRGDQLRVIGKGNKERQIFLNDACLKALDDYLPTRQKAKATADNALFLNNRRERMGVRGVQLLVKKYLRLAGLDATVYSTHKLRHTAATLMYRYGKVDVLALQKILGHESLSTTQIYTHADDEQIKDAMRRNPLATYNKK